jgi:hypothetical protein
MCPDGDRNKEWLCWRRPKANYHTDRNNDREISPTTQSQFWDWRTSPWVPTGPETKNDCWERPAANFPTNRTAANYWSAQSSHRNTNPFSRRRGGHTSNHINGPGKNKYTVTYFGVCDCRRGMDWISHLLTTCIHHSELHFTDNWHTQTRVLSLLQSPLAVFWQRLLPKEIPQLPALRSSYHSRPCRTFVNYQLTTQLTGSQAGGHFTPTS